MANCASIFIIMFVYNSHKDHYVYVRFITVNSNVNLAKTTWNFSSLFIPKLFAQHNRNIGVGQPLLVSSIVAKVFHPSINLV